MNMIARLDVTIRAVCPIAGVSVGTPGDSGSVRIDYAPEATAPQRQAAADALVAFDWSEQAQAAWELSVSRQAALTSLLSRQDETAIGVRAAIFAVCDLVNLRLEALGQPKVLMLEILQYIASNPTIGDPH